MEWKQSIKGGDFNAAGNASSAVKKVLRQLNIDPLIIRRVVVALYEAEVNVVAHAWKGTMLVSIDTTGIRIRVEDDGPGIPDIEKAMEAGYSTASAAVREMGFGAGMGLPNIQKNTDKLRIQSVEGKGTIVEMEVYF